MMRLETINAIAALNAAAVAADKIGTKRVYYCQRCLNHNRLEPRKNHKCECVFANCACNKCILVEKRRVLNTQLHELEDIADMENVADADGHYGLSAKSKGERVPNCQKCGQHGRKSRLKGHKRVCPYKDCDCAKCQVVSERQKLMADQIKIRRRQRKDTLLNITRENITATLNAAAAVAATGPLPYLQNINVLLYKQLQQNMRSSVSFLNPQPSPTENMIDRSPYSTYLSSSPTDTLKLGLKSQTPPSQQPQPSPQGLPHLQYLFQPTVTTTSTPTTVSSTDYSPPLSSSSSNTLETPPVKSSPPLNIAVPVPINPLLNKANTLGSTLASQAAAGTLASSLAAGNFLGSNIGSPNSAAANFSTFLENDHIFQTILSNMRLLERKISMDMSSKAENNDNVVPSAFVDVCTM